MHLKRQMVLINHENERLGQKLQQQKEKVQQKDEEFLVNECIKKTQDRKLLQINVGPL